MQSLCHRCNHFAINGAADRWCWRLAGRSPSNPERIASARPRAGRVCAGSPEPLHPLRPGPPLVSCAKKPPRVSGYSPVSGIAAARSIRATNLFSKSQFDPRLSWSTDRSLLVGQRGGCVRTSSRRRGFDISLPTVSARVIRSSWRSRSAWSSGLRCPSGCSTAYPPTRDLVDATLPLIRKRHQAEARGAESPPFIWTRVLERGRP